VDYLVPCPADGRQGNRWVFKGQLADGRACVVKFSTKKYPTDLHRLLADNTYAPELLAYQVFDPWIHVVVMEYIADAQYYSHQLHNRLEARLRAAVDLMHGSGWVHGDIRDANVLVKGDNVYLIDFEWAGQPELNGEVIEQGPRYPSLNPAIWTSNIRKHFEDIPIAEGKFIYKEHDRYMLERLCGAKGKGKANANRKARAGQGGLK
jgi:serine/threonine protein kinase